MVAMSFFIVRNYRMQEDFVMKNWVKMRLKKAAFNGPSPIA
jgi:hypothetical protein